MTQRRRKRGTGRHPLYATWSAMVQRCTNPSSPVWANYGGRGIAVCERWRESFEAFLADMGPRPEGRSLDRIDNDRGYAPENCRWGTAEQQLGNRRGCITVTINGEALNLAEAARRHGIPPHVARDRRRMGWPEARWFEPVVPRSFADRVYLASLQENT